MPSLLCRKELERRFLRHRNAFERWMKPLKKGGLDFPQPVLQGGKLKRLWDPAHIARWLRLLPDIMRLRTILAQRPEQLPALLPEILRIRSVILQGPQDSDVAPV